MCESTQARNEGTNSTVGGDVKSRLLARAEVSTRAPDLVFGLRRSLIDDELTIWQLREIREVKALALWQNIEARLDSSLKDWRNRVVSLGQVAAVEARAAGREWSDDETFKGLLMAVLSNNTDWSKIERVQSDLPKLFSEFSLKAYAELRAREIGDRILPWFLDRKAGSMTLEKDLVNLIGSARLLTEHSRVHGTAESYFTSLVRDLEGDAKQAALCLGSRGKYKLPAFGVTLAAEALKNLGFDVAKPDRHLTRAVASFGLVAFRNWPDRSGRTPPKDSSATSCLAVMGAVQDIATVADMPVVFVDNAIWLLCAKGGLYLKNPELANLAREGGASRERAEAVSALIRTWVDKHDGGEQRETIDSLVKGLDRERLSARKLFPEELKGRSW